MKDSKKTETTDNQSKFVAKLKNDPKTDRLAEALRANLRRRKQAAKKAVDEDGGCRTRVTLKQGR